MMSTRPHDEERVDGDDMMARFNPDPDCWPSGFQRRVYMIKWVHDESSADRLMDAHGISDFFACRGNDCLEI